MAGGIVSSYEIGGANYLHYYAINARNTLSPLYSKINRSKAQIMTGQRTILNNRTKKAIGSLNKGGMKQKDAEDLLSGKAFKDLGNIGLQGDVAKTFPETSKEAQAILKKSIAEIDNIQEFVTLLEKYVLNYFNTDDYTKLYQNYASSIVENYALLKNKPEGSIATSIVDSILGRYNESFFRMQGKSLNIPTDIAKMLALISSLPNPESSGSISATGSSNSDISKALLGKAQRWVNQMQKIAGEAAAAQAMMTAQGKLGRALKGVEKEFVATGNKNFSTNFKPDAKQQALLEETNMRSGVQNTKRAKSDVSLYINKDNVVAQIGFSVKEYKSIGKDGSISGARINLQKETPLMTALMREAGISGKDLHAIYQLAVAQGEEDSLNYQWDQLVQYASYRMFLNAAMGFAGTEDQSFFMVINGGIYTMSDILNNIMSSGSKVLISEYVNKRNGAIGGLVRETYRQMNEDLWQGERYKPSRPLAYERSQMLEPAVSNMMYLTKIRIDVKISELAILAKNL